MSQEKDIYILGIESSCDETAAAVVKNGREVLSNIISSHHKRLSPQWPQWPEYLPLLRHENLLLLLLLLPQFLCL